MIFNEMLYVWLRASLKKNTTKKIAQALIQ